MNQSIPMEVSEFINVVPINPLISKCQIKVCWVGEDPNRNQTVITKEAAKKLAPSLPGCPIVGYFNEKTQDFEEHNRSIKIANGQLSIIDDTKPYGFVDMNAKIWFQYFQDFDGVVREYLMTEGYIWTGIYEESKRIPEKGNNQSMELHEKSLQGYWAKSDNEINKFFIINDGLFKKLCVLGENVEPCFEGAQIATNFSLNDELRQSLIAMANELKEILREGGLYTMENEKIVNPQVEAEEEKEEVLNEFKKKEEEEKKPTEDAEKDSEKEEEPEKKPAEDAEKKEGSEEKKESEEDEEEKKKNKNTYSLEDIPEYQEMVSNYSKLEANYNKLQSDFDNLKTQCDDLAQFKANIDLEKKQEMINSFYMLSDEDKKEVTENISNYSLEDIEAKLSVICFRNKISFDLETEKESEEKEKPTTFSLKDTEDVSVPAWIKAVDKRKNNN